MSNENHIEAFNHYPLISTEVDFLQDQTQADIKNRALDRTKQAGVVIPATSTSVQIGAGCTGEFEVTLKAGHLLDVGRGIAYNQDGNRIEIKGADVVVWDPAAPGFTTSGVSGTPITPFSTGHLDVGDPASGSTGDRYLVITYLPVVETVLLPPNHYGADGDISGVPATGLSYREPITLPDQKQGLAYAHHFIDGYEVSIVTGLPSATDTVVLAKFYNDATTGFGSLDYSVRPLLIDRGMAGALIDSGAKTTDYISDDDRPRTFIEHVNTVGHATVTKDNPHGTDITDIPGAVTQTQIKDIIANGIVDTTLARNAPTLDVTTMQMQLINPGTVTPKYEAQIDDIGLGTLTVIRSATNAQRIAYCDQLVTNKELYVDGLQFVALSPTAAVTGITKGYTSFNADDDTGNYVIFAINPDKLGPSDLALLTSQFSADAGRTTGVALLGKFKVDSTPYHSDSRAAFSVPGVMELGRVFWDKAATELRASPYSATTTTKATDTRNVGIISTPQISSVLQADPEHGLLTTGSPNLLHDGDFEWDVAGTEDDGATHGLTHWYLKKTTGGACAITEGDYNGTNNHWVAGPKMYRALKVELVPAGNNVDVDIDGTLVGIKPSTTYTLSGWINVPTPSSLTSNAIKISAFIAANNAGGATISENDAEISVNRDGAWHKFSVTIKTETTPAITDLARVLRIWAREDGWDVSTSIQTFYLAALMLNEGPMILPFSPRTRTYVTNNMGSFVPANNTWCLQSTITINVGQPRTVLVDGFVQAHPWNHIHARHMMMGLITIGTAHLIVGGSAMSQAIGAFVPHDEYTQFIVPLTTKATVQSGSVTFTLYSQAQQDLSGTLGNLSMTNAQMSVIVI